MTWRTDVRQAGVSRHNGGANTRPPLLELRMYYRIEGFKGALKWSPIMPRGAKMLCSRNNFIQSGVPCVTHELYIDIYI